MLGSFIAGAIASAAIRTIIKDNKEEASKEEIKNNIRDGLGTISKYTTAVVEIAQEKLSYTPCNDDEVIIEKSYEDEYFEKLNRIKK